MMKYFQSKIIKGVSIEEIRPRVEEGLKKQGFGVLTEIDIKATMKKKLGKDYLPHVILGACNPHFADKVLSIEPTISTLLPCNVTLREQADGSVELAIMSPLIAMKGVRNPDIEPIAQEVQEKLETFLDEI